MVRGETSCALGAGEAHNVVPSCIKGVTFMVMRTLGRAIDHPQIRAIDRITNSYIVAVIEAIMQMTAVDPVDALILSLINAKNVSAFVQNPELSRQYADWTHKAPDSLRQPISRRAVASSLNLPVETVRRRIERLIKLGIVGEVDGGVIVVGDREGAPALNEAIFSSNLQLLRRMLSQFRIHGIDIAAEMSGEPAEPVETPR